MLAASAGLMRGLNAGAQVEGQTTELAGEAQQMRDAKGQNSEMNLV